MNYNSSVGTLQQQYDLQNTAPTLEIKLIDITLGLE